MYNVLYTVVLLLLWACRVFQSHFAALYSGYSTTIDQGAKGIGFTDWVNIGLIGPETILDSCGPAVNLEKLNR